MNRIDLDGRVAVVTGGAGGIGLATAQRMLESGARVAIWDRDRASLDAACMRIPALATESSERPTGRSRAPAASISW